MCGHFSCHRLGNGHLGSNIGVQGGREHPSRESWCDFQGVGSEGTRRGPLAPWPAATNLEGKELADTVISCTGGGSRAGNVMGETSEVGRKGSRNTSQPWRSLARPTEWVSEMGFAAGERRERVVGRWSCVLGL